MKTVPVAVLIDFSVYPPLRPSSPRQARRGLQSDLGAYGPNSKHPQHLFSAVMEWGWMERIQNFIFTSWHNSKGIFFSSKYSLSTSHEEPSDFLFPVPTLR